MTEPNEPDAKPATPTQPPAPADDAVPDGQADYGSAGQQAAEGVDDEDR